MMDRLSKDVLHHAQRFFPVREYFGWFDDDLETLKEFVSTFLTIFPPSTNEICSRIVTCDVLLFSFLFHNFVAVKRNFFVTFCLHLHESKEELATLGYGLRIFNGLKTFVTFYVVNSRDDGFFPI